jgi:hypothetical protein
MQKRLRIAIALYDINSEIKKKKKRQQLAWFKFPNNFRTVAQFFVKLQYS